MQPSFIFPQLIEEGFLTPLDLYFADMHKPASPAERAHLAAVMQSAREGHLCLDLDEVNGSDKWKMLVQEGKGVESPYLVKEEGRVYLQKNYQYETEILKELKRLVGEDVLQRVVANLTDEQQAALDLVRKERVSLIAGGPGTGKTHLISELVKSFGGKVLVAAPTGKAAGRLREKNPGVCCGTLHAILGIKSERDWDTPKYIQTDLIVVDEGSMIDVKMMRTLLKSLQTGQRIVFLGDGNQLPPVESGSVFSDLIGSIPTAYLHTCLRSDRKEVLDLAQSILEGRQVFSQGSLSFDAICCFTKEHKQCAILTPLREGPWGVKELNQRLDQEFKSVRKPIMILRNDTKIALSNGDMGELLFDGEAPKRAYFDGREIPASLLPSYELAYALSVHKSQGSEFDHVLVLVPPGADAFGRQLLYTAATRARLSVSLLGDEEMISQVMKRSCCRKSGLKKRVAELLGRIEA